MEKLDGTREEVRLISKVLDEHRSNPERCINDDDDRKVVCSLADNGIAEKLGADEALFNTLVVASLSHIERHRGWRVSPISPERYFFIEVEQGDQGGFHSKKPGGFRHLYDAAYVPCLSPALSLTSQQLSLEYARCHLHDSLHRSTFRSYRRDRRSADHMRIYREKYGFNIRNADGVSYSSPTKPSQGGFINLNILMDGIIALLVSEALRESVKNLGRQEELAVHPLMKECLENACIAGSNSENFHTEVVDPTKRFMEYWQMYWRTSPTFIAQAVYSMKNGSHRSFKVVFDRLIGKKNGFSKLFKQKAFDRGVGRRHV